jgi:hypothetical protein
MANPTIVPPTPTVTQPGQGVDNSPGMESVQRAFDQAFPEIRTRPTEPSKEPAKPAEAPAEPVTPPKEPDKPASEVKPDEGSGHDVPSFLEEALRGTPSSTTPPAAVEEWPEELPEFKNSEEAKGRYKKWREAYGKLKDELKTLQEKPTLNAQQIARMEQLERENQQMQGVLSRVGVEHSMEFQNSIIRPLQASWNEAVRIVKEAGADPQQLARAMSMSGRAQFEALDDLFQNVPESAKAEATEALRMYRKYEEARKQTLANAPAAMEGIRKREEERATAELTQQRKGMAEMFNQNVARLRDDAKLELLLRTDSPDGKWWNEQGERIVNEARELFLENTDMNKVAMACILAPAADAYRKLWMNSQKKIGELQKIIKDKIGNEPNLSESSGSQGIPNNDAQLKADLNRPFLEVFLREFHKSQARAGR